MQYQGLFNRNILPQAEKVNTKTKFNLNYMNEKEKLQMEINELLKGQEQLLIPALEAHFYAIEKDDKNGFSKNDYLKWYAEVSGKELPFIPLFVKSDKNQSWINNMIDKACNEESMNKFQKEENVARLLNFVKFLILHEIEGFIRSRQTEF